MDTHCYDACLLSTMNFGLCILSCFIHTLPPLPLTSWYGYVALHHSPFGLHFSTLQRTIQSCIYRTHTRRFNRGDDNRYGICHFRAPSCAGSPGRVDYCLQLLFGPRSHITIPSDSLQRVQAILVQLICLELDLFFFVLH